MFLKKIYALMTAIPLIIPFNDLHAGNAHVVLHLKTGEQINRQLYAVNDSSLVVYARDANTEYLRIVMIRDIQKVTLKNKPKILLILKDGRQISRLLDSVSDSSLSIFEKETTLEGGHSEIISEVRSEEIHKIVFKGESKVLKGMGMGLLIGAGTGAVIGLASGDDQSGFFRFSAGEKALMGGIFFGGAGLLVGTVAGAATSTGDTEIEFFADQPFSLLKPFARHFER